MNPSNEVSPSRIPELDGVRGMAILLVILYHYVAVPIPADASPGFLFVRQLFSNGWSGVDLFFVLSGFLITGILIDHREAENYFAVFYTRRISRIFPLYYFFLLLFFVLQRSETRGYWSAGLFANSLPLLPYFFFLQNLTMAAYGDFGNKFLAVTWSLAIEEQFYLLLPLVVRRSLPQRLPLNVVFLIGLPIVLRATLGGSGFFHGFVLTPWRLDTLFLGSLLAIVVRKPKALAFLSAHLAWVKAAFFILLLFVVYSSMTEEVGSLDHLFVFGVFYTTLVFLALADKTGFLARFFRYPVLRYLGQISYGMYLFHQLINGILHDLFFGSAPRVYSVSTILVTLFAFLVTCLVATGTYHAFEKRFIAWGHKCQYRMTSQHARDPRERHFRKDNTGKHNNGGCSDG